MIFLFFLSFSSNEIVRCVIISAHICCTVITAKSCCYLLPNFTLTKFHFSSQQTVLSQFSKKKCFQMYTMCRKSEAGGLGSSDRKGLVGEDLTSGGRMSGYIYLQQPRLIFQFMTNFPLCKYFGSNHYKEVLLTSSS